MLSPKLNISLFNSKIFSFHFFGVLGFIFGTLLSLILAHELRLQISIILMLGLTGAVIFFGLVYAVRSITGDENIVYYHHEIAILLFSAIVLYFTKSPILSYLDIELVGIGTFLAFGRIGCFSVGCCHGRPHKYGVKYGQLHVNAGFTWFYKDVPLFPVQLIESAYVFFIVFAGIILLLSHIQPGTVLIVYTVLYGLMRYILEFFRGDPERPIWQGLSEAQWTTLALTAITFIMSKAGWLPLYNWHWMILIAMIVVSSVTVYYYKKDPEKKFFYPSHILEMAEALSVLHEVNLLMVEDNPDRVNVFTTQQGLCISCSTEQSGITVNQYTISCKNKIIINIQSAHKLANLICKLKNLVNKYELIETRNGIYHILFNENKIAIEK